MNTPLRFARNLLGFALILSLSACGGSTPGASGKGPACEQTQRAVMQPGDAAPRTAAQQQAGPPAEGNSSTYVIGAGDVLGVNVYRAPELSVPNIPVRPDGRISMPLIPDIVAAGKTQSWFPPSSAPSNAR